MRDKLVKVLAAYELFQIVEEVETFLVRYGAKCILRVDTLVVNDEFSELVISSMKCNRVL